MYVLRTEQSSNVRKPSQAMTIQTNPLFHSLGVCSRSWRNESPRCGFDWFAAGLAKTIYRRITTVSQFYVVSTSHCPYHFRACVQHQAGSRMQSISNAVCCWAGPRSSVEPTSQNSRLHSFPDQGIVSLCGRFDLSGPRRDETTNESMELTRETLKCAPSCGGASNWWLTADRDRFLGRQAVPSGLLSPLPCRGSGFGCDSSRCQARDTVPGSGAKLKVCDFGSCPTVAEFDLFLGQRSILRTPCCKEQWVALRSSKHFPS